MSVKKKVVAYLDTSQGRRIAYHRMEGSSPWVVFLPGLRSSMEGTKAIHLESWALTRGQSFLRYDYSGHGLSSGNFETGCIGDWAEDTFEVINALTFGEVVLVGSSMGGWQSLLFARDHGQRVAGMVTIAAAPDFTEKYRASFTGEQRTTLNTDGKIEVFSNYMSPHIITKKLIEDGCKYLIFCRPLHLPFPVRMLLGSADEVVSSECAVRLLNHADSPDMRLILVKGADHRFSDGFCLQLIDQAVLEIIEQAVPR